MIAKEALRLAIDLRSKATSIDGWCSSCMQIDRHKEWCPWTRLIEYLEKAATYSPLEKS